MLKVLRWRESIFLSVLFGFIIGYVLATSSACRIFTSPDKMYVLVDFHYECSATSLQMLRMNSTILLIIAIHNSFLDGIFDLLLFARPLDDM